MRNRRITVNHRLTIQRLSVILVPLIQLCLPANLPAYSVLSHETLVDAAWEIGILPLLRERFPNAMPDDLLSAHGFAYGGSIIQDLGYYPHGSHEYSDLVHYVRSGDFIQAMIRDAQDINEYAFALGALAHYVADNEGHSLAVNRAVPVLYPHLRDLYGNVVTYEDNPVAHAKTEFGFDVLEVAKHRFATDSYRKFIGFKVAKELLERAFKETYSVPLASKFPSLDTAIGSFRYTATSLIPEAVKVAWALKQNEIKQDLPGMTRRKFLYNLSRASYEKEWGKNYQGPGLGSKVLAFLMRVVPKVGPLRVLSLQTPTPETEQMFESSFNSALQNYRHHLQGLREGKLNLPNRNLDTGGVAASGTYFMMDGAYARLLDQLASQGFERTSPALHADILAYFSGMSLQTPIRRDKLDKSKVKWSRVPQQLQALIDSTPKMTSRPTPEASESNF